MDIGKNIGLISIPSAYFCQDCKVIGIEAISSNFQKAVANGKFNGLSNLQQINVALQDPQNVTSLMFETTPKLITTVRRFEVLLLILLLRS